MDFCDLRLKFGGLSTERLPQHIPFYLGLEHEWRINCWCNFTGRRCQIKTGQHGGSDGNQHGLLRLQENRAESVPAQMEESRMMVSTWFLRGTTGLGVTSVYAGNE
jgi:hypothetical protein